MGNSCCQLKQENGGGGDRSFPRRSTSIVAPSGNPSGNLGLMSDKVTPQRMDERTSIDGKIQNQRVHTEDQQVAPIAAAGTDENEVYETRTLKSNDDKNTFSEGNPVADDACKKSEISNRFRRPTIEYEEDFCPTCLEGYDEENPKILTKCNHHYHLGCILEWMQRSDTCPICDKEMVYEETS